MFSIRIGRETVPVSAGELIKKLSEQKGSISVIMERPSGMKAVSYVDVEDGVVRKSYGDRRALKESDFTEGGDAFA